MPQFDGIQLSQSPILSAKGVPVLILGTCEMLPYMGKGIFADVIKVKNPKIGKSSWVLQVGPI